MFNLKLWWDKLQANRLINKSQRYIKKKLSYHEAGHLVMSYLLGIKCQYIQVIYDRIDQEQVVNGQLYLTPEFKSESQVYHLLPPEMNLVLHSSYTGIVKVAKQFKRSEDEIWLEVIKYLIILLAGKYSDATFWNEIKDDKMEVFLIKYSQDLTTRNIKEDVTRAKFILNQLTNDNKLKNRVIKTVEDFLNYYFQQRQVKSLIDEFAKKAYKQKRIDQPEIESIFDKAGFMTYCNDQQSEMSNLLQFVA